VTFTELLAAAITQLDRAGVTSSVSSRATGAVSRWRTGLSFDAQA
jgi:hypothetical protein